METVTMRSRSDINKNIMRKKQTFYRKLRGLTYIGYYGNAPFSNLEFREDNRDVICGIIRSRLEKTKTINRRISSYELKHLVEKQVEASGTPCKGYVSNGELIYAMILEGFEIEVCGMNAFFNVSSRSVKRLPKAPRYDRKGNVYDYRDLISKGENAKPVFRINISEYEEKIDCRELWWMYDNEEEDEE